MAKSEPGRSFLPTNVYSFLSAGDVDEDRRNKERVRKAKATLEEAEAEKKKKAEQNKKTLEGLMPERDV